MMDNFPSARPLLNVRTNGHHSNWSCTPVESIPQSVLKNPSVSQPFNLGDIGTRFGQRLRQLRRAHNMTQLDMAILLGIDRSFISEVECAKKGISLELVEVIAIGFNLTLSDLLQDL